MELLFAAAAREIASPPRGGDGRRRTDDAPDQERTQSAGALFAFHGTIV